MERPIGVPFECQKDHTCCYTAGSPVSRVDDFSLPLRISTLSVPPQDLGHISVTGSETDWGLSTHVPLRSYCKDLPVEKAYGMERDRKSLVDGVRSETRTTVLRNQTKRGFRQNIADSKMVRHPTVSPVLTSFPRHYGVTSLLGALYVTTRPPTTNAD